MPGVLKALINGVWTNIPAGMDEVWISPNEPTNPGIELWYDTDEPGALTVTSWTPVTFLNAWANKGGAEQPCQYRKVGDVVELRGTMTKLAPTYGQAAFQLPVGFRPPFTLRPNPLVLNAAGTQSLGRADMIGDGNYAPQAGPSDAGWWAIDMRFSTV